MSDALYQVTLPADQVLSYVVMSKAALRSHAMPEGELIEPTADLGVAFQSPADMAHAGIKPVPGRGRAQLTIWHLNPPGDGIALWERMLVPDITRNELDQLVAQLIKDQHQPILGEVAGQVNWFTPPADPATNELVQYNPERIRRLRSYGEALNRCGLRHKGQQTVALLKDVMEIFRNADAHDLEEFPRRRRFEKDRGAAREIQYYIESLSLFTAFCGSGRQIFDIPPRLAEMFAKSDVDDIQWAHVKFPYPNIYLHFGPQQHLSLGGGWLVEGAYLSDVGTAEVRNVNIAIVAAPPSLDTFLSVDTVAPPVYISSLGPEHMSMPLAEAAELVLSERLRQLKVQSETEPLREDLERQAREMGAPPGARIVSVQRERAAEELALLQIRNGAYVGMLRLVVNALCYLTAYPKDIAVRWPPGTPKAMLKELERAGTNRNEHRRVMTRLAAQGYSPVHLCGRQLEAELAAQEDVVFPGSADARIVATHWARGHWKRQPYGPQNSLRKMQWRMPVLRRSRSTEGDSDGEEPLGHIYLTQ